MDETNKELASALARVIGREANPQGWVRGGDFPWHEPEFGRRALAEHLDDSHPAASQPPEERTRQIDWLIDEIGLIPGQRVLDVACGPGLYSLELARRGFEVVGIDINPAAIEFARVSAEKQGLEARCRFFEADIRRPLDVGDGFDSVWLLYGQLAPLEAGLAKQVRTQLTASMLPGGALVLELLDPDRIDRDEHRWWFANDRGVWGDRPYLHLGERTWNEAGRFSVERYWVIELETGVCSEYELCDQSYDADEINLQLRESGCSEVRCYRASGEVQLNDGDEWLVHIGLR